MSLVGLDRKIKVIDTHYKGNQTDQSQIKAGHFVNQNSKKNAQRQANKTASLSQLIPTQGNPYLEAIK